MKLIISHENLDFDGLSSMVACKLLFPDAVVSYSGKLGSELKSFINLYKYTLQIFPSNEIDLDKVRSLIIVDTNTSNRIGKYEELLHRSIDVTIYDHHRITEETIDTPYRYIEPYGACTTLLLKEIIRKKIQITPFQATLFLLGIYADTNCLTFKSTTSEDAEVVAYLFRQNPNLDIVNEYLYEVTSDEQDRLLMTHLTNLESMEIKNHQIYFSTSEESRYINGLSNIASKITHIKNADGLFLISKMGEKIYIIGRSLEDEINIAEILEPLGGGGHRRAGSASIKEIPIEEVKEKLIQLLKSKIAPQLKARDIMSYPVKTLFEDMTVEEANRVMLRYGHTGMPVVKDDDLIGIISRTDLDKAIIHDLSHAPIKGFMRQKVITISPDASISEINDLLTKHNIGRVPVMENDRIIGIVTRTNLLQMIHGDSIPRWYKSNYDQSYEILDVRKIISRLDPEINAVIDLVANADESKKEKTYIVGGFVRDLILNVPNDDLDFVTEGDAIQLAHEVNRKIKGRLIKHESFRTASIVLTNGQHIDFVSARREYYEYPAALPIVEQSTIWNDLFRRDFTINCMAIQLSGNHPYQLIDYFSGLEDLKNGIVRVLYNLSFIEDPTRIFRGIRFASRYDFIIEEETKKFIVQAVQDDMIKKLSFDRIRDELIGILKDKNLKKSLRLMEELKIFSALGGGLNLQSSTIEKIENLTVSIQEFHMIDSSKINKIHLIVRQLFSQSNLRNLHELLMYYVGNKGDREEILSSLGRREKIYRILKEENVSPYTIYSLLEDVSDESIIFYYNDCDNNNVKHFLMYYKLKLERIRLVISGQDLLDMKIKPGPVFKRILKETLKAKIQGLVYTKDDERYYAIKLYKNYEEMKGNRNYDEGI